MDVVTIIETAPVADEVSKPANDVMPVDNQSDKKPDAEEELPMMSCQLTTKAIRSQMLKKEKHYTRILVSLEISPVETRGSWRALHLVMLTISQVIQTKM
jgi:hypothetical protein